MCGQILFGLGRPWIGQVASGSIELAWEAPRVWSTNIFDQFDNKKIICIKTSAGSSAFHLFSSQL